MNHILIETQFKKIKNKGFIKSVGHGSSAVGRTFEKELGIWENSLPYADYFGIEIKCLSRKEEDYITLFSLEPESIEGNVMINISEKYGYPDKDIKNINILNTNVSNKIKYISLKYKGYLMIDKINDNLQLLIENRNSQIVDTSAKWSLERLNYKIEDKCNYLVLILTEKRIFNKVEYFKYKEIKIYKFKGMNKFIEAIENGIVRVQFKITVYKSGLKKGQLHNHGTSFQIRAVDLEKIFERVI